jgi:hypothetical protein
MPGINFKLPLKQSYGAGTYFELNTDTQAALKENLRITLLTTKNERLINTIGSKFIFNVFEQDAEQIKFSIENEVKRIFDEYFSDELEFHKVDVIFSDGKNTLSQEDVLITIFYSYKDFEDSNDKLSMILR